MERDSFIFYRSFAEALEELPAEQYKAIMVAITKKALNDEEVELKGIEKVIFTLIKPQLEANNVRFNNGVKGAEFGKLGGRPRKEKEVKENIGVIDKNPVGDIKENPTGVIDKNPKKTPNVNVNVNENVNVNVKGDYKGEDAPVGAREREVEKSKPKKEVFEKPEPWEVEEEYLVRTGCIHTNEECERFAEKFIAHYDSCGWKVGRNPMKDWRAAVRTWIRNEDVFESGRRS